MRRRRKETQEEMAKDKRKWVKAKWKTTKKEEN